MTWVKLDDGFFDHPKANAAGKDGRELYLAGLCWSKANLTDGLIPKVMLRSLAVRVGVKAGPTADRLLSVGLWHDEGEHYRIHDYHEHNEPASKERKRKADHAERMRSWRAAREGQRDASRDGPQTRTRDASRALPDTDTEVVTRHRLRRV